MLNKIISLFMSVIMLVTALPALQAEDFTTSLNMAELNELKQEIAIVVGQAPFNYSSIPSAKESLPKKKF